MSSIDLVGNEEKVASAAEQLTALQTLREAVCRHAKCIPGGGDALENPTRNAAAIELACYWEATAPKVGNVHPGATFFDCSYDDFCQAAKCVAPILAGLSTSPVGLDSNDKAKDGVGDRVLRSIEATRKVTAANVNLGIVLLIAPLATARDRGDISRVLSTIDSQQTALVYRAIGLAAPGGVKPAEVEPKWDVTSKPESDSTGNGNVHPEPIDLIAAMRMARQRDRIALQYSDDFLDFFESVVPLMASELAMKHEPGEAILRGQLKMLAQRQDTLIARKCGLAIAEEAKQRAAACFDVHGNFCTSAIAGYDRWLRADGNRRNPGTTADLIAAAVYWLIR
jgi:triphosphoribosyl-dephospho-CoA synthase